MSKEFDKFLNNVSQADKKNFAKIKDQQKPVSENQSPSNVKPEIGNNSMDQVEEIGKNLKAQGVEAQSPFDKLANKQASEQQQGQEQQQEQEEER